MGTRCKLFHAIYQVLLMHKGPIHEFALSMYVDYSCVEIDHIILHLSRQNTVKILTLDLSGGYKLPFSLFSLHQLTELYISGCVLEHLPSSIELGSLTTLNLQEVWTCEEALMNVLSSCPLLRLTIGSDGGTIYVSEGSTVAGFMECLQDIEYLSFWCFIFLSFSSLPRELPITLVHLKYLCMEHVCFSHIHVLPILVLFIRSSLNLENLKLQVSKDEMEDESYMGSSALGNCSDISLEQLNKLEILHFSNEENGLVFVKLILAKSPTLKKVRILLWDQLAKKEKLQISKKI